MRDVPYCQAIVPFFNPCTLTMGVKIEVAPQVEPYRRPLCNGLPIYPGVA
jgi:hypothetical protein